jgi:hypothetical protein
MKSTYAYRAWFVIMIIAWISFWISILSALLGYRSVLSFSFAVFWIVAVIVLAIIPMTRIGK